MEEQVVTTIETNIVETDKFHGTASVGDDVYIYRRLVDMCDKTAVAMLNSEDEVVGYLNREVAEKPILPYLKRGLKFNCVITEKPDEQGNLPIEIHFRLPEKVRQMNQEEDSISLISGVGPILKENFAAIGIYTGVELVQRVESGNVQQILEEIKRNTPGARLSLGQIEKIYKNAKEKYLPTPEEVSASAVNEVNGRMEARVEADGSSE